MPTTTAIQNAFRNIYSQMITQMAVRGTALALGNGYENTQAINAITHTQTSAMTAYYLGDSAAKALGDIKETQSDPGHEADSMKDQYNNEVGRQIEDWITVTVHRFRPADRARRCFKRFPARVMTCPHGSLPSLASPLKWRARAKEPLL